MFLLQLIEIIELLEVVLHQQLTMLLYKENYFKQMIQKHPIIIGLVLKYNQMAQMALLHQKQEVMLKVILEL